MSVFSPGRPLRAALLVGVGLALVGCSTLPGARPSAGPLPEAWQDAPQGADVAQLADWWVLAEDPTLNRLVREALSEGSATRLAALRLAESRALARQVVAGNLPVLDATASGQYTQVLDGQDQLGSFRGFLTGSGAPPQQEATQFVGAVGPRISWEIPLFARIEAAVFGARATQALAEADVRATAVAVVADTAETYVAFRAAQNTQLALLEAAAAAEDLARITAIAAGAGLTSAADAADARRLAATVRGRVPSAELEVQRAVASLAVLRGRAPGTETEELLTALTSPAPVPSLPFGRVPAAPAELLRLRPDVASAEARALQQAADLAIARVDRWPALRLTGSVAASDNLIGTGLGTRQIELGAQPQIVLPLFDWGQRQAAVRVRDSRFQQAMIGYRDTVNQAVAEAGTALAGVQQSAARLASAREAEDAAAVTARGARAAYGAGIQSLTDRLRADQQLIDARIARIEAEAASARAAIAAYRAFGGGPAGVSPP